jgi:hypothetical protein
MRHKKHTCKLQKYTAQIVLESEINGRNIVIGLRKNTKNGDSTYDPNLYVKLTQ